MRFGLSDSPTRTSAVFGTASQNISIWAVCQDTWTGSEGLTCLDIAIVCVQGDGHDGETLQVRVQGPLMVVTGHRDVTLMELCQTAIAE